MRNAPAPVVPIVPIALWIFAATLFVVGLPVAVAPGSTDRLFAWTIDVKLTAAFLGASYWSAMAFSVLAARERVWAHVRAIIPGTVVAGGLILLATLLHLDRFAMETVRGWVWLVLYAGLVPGALLVAVLQRRAGGADPPPGRPLERGAALALGAGGTLAAGLGAALFLLPEDTASWWPWPLTELTARMTGAWLVALGATMFAARREGDWTRLRAPMAYLAILAVLQLATLARDPDAVDWDAPSAWLYVAALLGLLALGARGLAAAHPASGGLEPRISNSRS